MSVETNNNGDREVAPVGAESDPIGLLLSDPESHLSDILYLNFRHYKKRLIQELFLAAIGDIDGKSEEISVVDVGAAMGHDLLYIVRCLQKQGRSELISRLRLLFLEGDPDLMHAGETIWKNMNTGAHFEFDEVFLTEPLEIGSNSIDIAVCSEVVEHLEEPDRLLAEIFRILKPGGQLVFTTDNSPSLPQLIRRIPRLVTGQYKRYYGPADKEAELAATYEHNGKQYRIYGHISLRSTWAWEAAARKCGFKVVRYGTYQSIRRGGAGHRPVTLAAMFLAGFVNSCLPRSIGRCFGDTTALLLQKPAN